MRREYNTGQTPPNSYYLGNGDAGVGFQGESVTYKRPSTTTPSEPSTPTTITDNYGIGDYSGSKREAEYTYRDMYKAQWQDYKNRFLPYQDKLIDAVTSRDMLDEQLSRISATSDRSKKLSAETAMITRSRYGMEQTAQQQQSFNSNSNLNSALGLANAENNARSSAYDRYQSAMTGAGIRPQETVGQTGGATS